MNEFYKEASLIVQKLNTSGYSEEAKKLENALQISNVSLEILGETRQVLARLEKKRILKKLDCDSTVKNLRELISKY